MTSLSREVRSVQNPALGATLIWRFIVGYSNQSAGRPQVPLPLAFMVLPIVLHEETCKVLRSTQSDSGLFAFADKFSRSDSLRADLLLSIQPRIDQFKKLTWESLQVAFDRRLISLDPATPTVTTLLTTPPAGVPTSVRPLLDNSEKLGVWCAQLTLFEISSVLKVQL